ncbi:MAG: hypothetical protein IJ567_07480 [Lachnospiraceae bacterium]|nr:hypothetical protein [Lachnospiraceae bacterium]
MKRIWSILLMAVFISGILSGCGRTADADTNTIFIEKKGVIEEVTVGEFSESNYDLEEFKSFVEENIKSYEDSGAGGKVSLEKATEINEIVKLVMSYDSCKTYTDFVGSTLYVGTVVQAMADGYDFEATFHEAAEDSEDAVDKKEILGHDAYNVAVVSALLDVHVDGTIVYVSDGVTVKNKNTATVEDTTESGCAYIVYK